mgnify:CR=1 FL=1
MAYNKIIYGKKTLIDLTSDTVDASTLTKGTTAHDKSGAKITGTLETPSGTINITNNGVHVVKNYANANVNVPIPAGYIKPEGTKEITANGTTDVTSYANVNVNVPTPEKCQVKFSKSSGWTAYVSYFDADKNQFVLYDDMGSSVLSMTKNIYKGAPIVITMENYYHYYGSYTPAVSVTSGSKTSIFEAGGVHALVVTSDTAEIYISRA